MVCIGTPSTLALSRSMFSSSARPWLDRLLSTSASSGRWRSAWVRRLACSATSALSTSDSEYWYSVAATRVSRVTSCTGLRYNATPGMPATACCRRGRICSRPSRSPRSLSTIDSWPWLSVGFMVPAPMKAETPVTAGSLRSASATALVRCSICGKAMFWSACTTPVIRPVSCSGSRPLGITMYSTTVSTSAPAATARVSGW
ncbi:hypothetical protein D3C71_1338010 [compost metagenome]